VGKWVIMRTIDGPVTRRTFSGILPSNRSIDVVLRPRNVRIKKKHVIVIQDVRVTRVWPLYSTSIGDVKAQATEV